MIVYILKMLQTQNCIWYHSCSDSYSIIQYRMCISVTDETFMTVLWLWRICTMSFFFPFQIFIFCYCCLIIYEQSCSIVFVFFLLLLLKCFMNNIPFSYLYHRKLLLLILFVHTCIYFNHKLTENSVYILSNWQRSNIKF